MLPDSLQGKGEQYMVKKLLTVLFLSVLVFALSAPLVAQDTKAKPKKDSWEGTVTIISKDKSTLVVRKGGENIVKTVAYDAMTEWTSQEHGKKATTIDSSQIKEGDRVICRGTYSKDGVLHATLISKRLTEHSAIR
jgi:hypothetical protein